MKPLTEWTTEELRVQAARGAFLPAQLQCIDELIRRAKDAMKERCAAVAEGWPRCRCADFCEGYGCHSFRQLAGELRGLQ